MIQKLLKQRCLPYHCFTVVFLTPSIMLLMTQVLSLASMLDPFSRQKARISQTHSPVARGKLECSTTLKVPYMYRKITGGSNSEPSAPFPTQLGAGPVAGLEAIELGRI